MVPIDTFLAELNEAIGLSTKCQILPPLVQLISEYARSFWLLSSVTEKQSQQRKGKRFSIYDPYTRKMIHTQDIETFEWYLESWTILTRSIDRSLFLFVQTTVAGYLPTNSIFRVRYNDLTSLYSKENQKDQNKENKSSFLSIADKPITSYESTSNVEIRSPVCTGRMLYFQDVKFRWHGFDLETEKWIVCVSDEKRYQRGGDGFYLVTSISDRSFIGLKSIDRLQGDVISEIKKFRCFSYNGESSSSSDSQNCIIYIADFEVCENIDPLTIGHIRDEKNDMVAILFYRYIVLIKIKTRLPSLTFDPPSIVKIDPVPGSGFIFIDSILWCFLQDEKAEIRQEKDSPIRQDMEQEETVSSFQFCFESLKWIESSRVPRELLYYTLMTVI
jgi:hypothetical protein